MWPSYGYWRPGAGAWPGYWEPPFYGWPWAPAQMPKDQEIAMLEDQAEILEVMLDSVRKRLEALKK